MGNDAISAQNKALCEAREKQAVRETLVVPASCIKKVQAAEAAGASGNSRYRVAKVGQADKINQNDRIYPSAEWAVQIHLAKTEKMAQGLLCGAVDHQGYFDGGNLKDTAIIWRELRMESDGGVFGEFEIVKDHSRGKDLQAQIDAGMAIGFSTFGYANGHPPSDEERQKYGLTADQPATIIENWDLVKIDTVDNPSVSDARIQPEQESKVAHLNEAGESFAHSLVRSGKVNRTASWSFTASDGDALLGDGGDDWTMYGKCHLGVNASAPADSKRNFKYPFAKKGDGEITLFRSGVVAVRQRASQQGHKDIFDAAGNVLGEIDKAKQGRENQTMKTLAELKISHPEVFALHEQAVQTESAKVTDLTAKLEAANNQIAELKSKLQVIHGDLEKANKAHKTLSEALANFVGVLGKDHAVEIPYREVKSEEAAARIADLEKQVADALKQANEANEAKTKAEATATEIKAKQADQERQVKVKAAAEKALKGHKFAGAIVRAVEKAISDRAFDEKALEKLIADKTAEYEAVAGASQGGSAGDLGIVGVTGDAEVEEDEDGLEHEVGQGEALTAAVELAKQIRGR